MTLTDQTLLAETETTRERTNQSLREGSRSALGQFMTPGTVASFMASMFRELGPDIRLLDAGAGVGSLTAAFVRELSLRSPKPRSIQATAYEVDPVMLSGLREVFDLCQTYSRSAGTRFAGRILDRDFVEDASTLLAGGLFAASGAPRFNAAILNPPYRKIGSSSRERLLLRRAGIETSNLYSAFVALAIRLLEPGGELVAITPRSFCNGPYFRPFRQLLLSETSLLRVHVFESRKRAFSADAVLQENVIFHAKKGARRGTVVVSRSSAPEESSSARTVPHRDVVDPADPNAFIHLPLSDEDASIARRMAELPCSLAELGLCVSTGRVVDYRAREFLRTSPGPRTVPLIYPLHFGDGRVDWPRLGGRKPNALLDEERTHALTVPNETYVLTKRLTSKEERRRVVAVVHDPRLLPEGCERVAFENHVNYFHRQGRGLPRRVAKGLAAYLGSTLVDRYFRQFNGHTQVNAVDLRSLRYPDLSVLAALGANLGNTFPDQTRIDSVLVDALG